MTTPNTSTNTSSPRVKRESGSSAESAEPPAASPKVKKEQPQPQQDSQNTSGSHILVSQMSVSPHEATMGGMMSTLTFDASSGQPRSPKPRMRSSAERRASHNAVERQRREALNARFLDLAGLLPPLATIRRPSKSSIVNSSIAHVHAAQRHRALATNQLRALTEECDALRREVNEWRDRAGGVARIPTPVRGETFEMLVSGAEPEMDELFWADVEGGMGEEAMEELEEQFGSRFAHPQQHPPPTQSQAAQSQAQNQFAYNVPAYEQPPRSAPPLDLPPSRQYVPRPASQPENMPHQHQPPPPQPLPPPPPHAHEYRPLDQGTLVHPDGSRSYPHPQRARPPPIDIPSATPLAHGPHGHGHGYARPGPGPGPVPVAIPMSVQMQPQMSIRSQPQAQAQVMYPDPRHAPPVPVPVPVYDQHPHPQRWAYGVPHPHPHQHPHPHPGYGEYEYDAYTHHQQQHHRGPVVAIPHPHQPQAMRPPRLLPPLETNVGGGGEGDASLSPATPTPPSGSGSHALAHAHAHAHAQNVNVNVATPTPRSTHPQR